MFGIFGNKKTKRQNAPVPMPKEDFDVLPNVRTFQKDMERMRNLENASPETPTKTVAKSKSKFSPLQQPPVPAINVQPVNKESIVENTAPKERAGLYKQKKGLADRKNLSPEAARSKIAEDLKDARLKWEKQHVTTGGSQKKPANTARKERPHTIDAPEKPHIIQQAKGASPIKTFQADVAGAVIDQKQSIARIAVAEQKKRALSQTNPKEKIFYKETYPTKKIVFAVIVFIVFVSISAGGWFAFSKYSNKQIAIEGEKKALPVTESIVTPDRQVVIDATDTPVPALKERVESEIAHDGEINELREIVLTEILPGAASHSRITTGFFLSLWAQNIPDRLKRNILNNFSFGTYSLVNNQIFIILEASNFEQALAGMLEWEKMLLSDISSLKGTPSKVSAGPFKDSVVAGKDVRILSDAFGNDVLMYLVPRNGVIVITAGAGSMETILDRGFN